MRLAAGVFVLLVSVFALAVGNFPAIALLMGYGAIGLSGDGILHLNLAATIGGAALVGGIWILRARPQN